MEVDPLNAGGNFNHKILEDNFDRQDSNAYCLNETFDPPRKEVEVGCVDKSSSSLQASSKIQSCH